MFIARQDGRLVVWLRHCSWCTGTLTSAWRVWLMRVSRHRIQFGGSICPSHAADTVVRLRAPLHGLVQAQRAQEAIEGAGATTPPEPIMSGMRLGGI